MSIKNKNTEEVSYQRDNINFRRKSIEIRDIMSQNIRDIIDKHSCNNISIMNLFANNVVFKG